MNPEQMKGNVDASDIFSFSQKKDFLRWRSQIYRKKVDVREIAQRLALEEKALERARVEQAREYYALRLASFVAKKQSQINQRELYRAVAGSASKKLAQNKASEKVESETRLPNSAAGELSRLEILRAMRELDERDARLRNAWRIAKKEKTPHEPTETFYARPTPTNFRPVQSANAFGGSADTVLEESPSFSDAEQGLELPSAKQEALAYFSRDFAASAGASPNSSQYSRASFDSSAARPRHAPSRGFISACFAVMCFVLAGGVWANGFSVKDNVVADATQAYETLNEAQKAVKDFRFKEAAVSFRKANIQFVRAEQDMNSMGKGLVAIVSILPFENKPRSGVYLIRAGAKLSRAGEALSGAMEALTASTMPTGSFSALEEAPSLSDAIFTASALAASAQQDLADAKADIDKVSSSDLPAEYRDQFISAKDRVLTMQNLFTALSSYSDGALIFLGNSNPKTYLVIFQNPAEIRATGGFAGTYGVMKLSRGQMASLFVDGIYNADGQLTVNVIPPQPIKHLSTAWSMHDANWFFDFPTSAEKIMWFYEKTGGETPDGVIALTPAVVERLLHIVGPINLPQYNLTVSEQNFSDVIQQQVEVNYDKQENAPKKVLADLTPILMERINAAFVSRAPEILDALAQSLQQKDIMLYSRDSEVERIFNDQGWSGKVSAPLAAKPNEIQDYFAVVHSNIGGYKTDKVTITKEEVTTTVQSDGSIRRVIRVVRAHNGGDTPYDWYNKPNVDYVRFYAPLGSQIIRAQGFSTAPQMPQFDYGANNFQADMLVQSTGLGSRRDSASGTDIFQENSMQVFGNWMVINPGKVQTVEVEYTIPQKMTERTAYFLSEFSQAGISPSVDINFNVGAWGSLTWCSQEGATSSTLRIRQDSLYGDKHFGCVVEKT